MSRFQYWSPKGLTRWWSFQFQRGCDEYHNKSIVIGVPFLGAIVVFWEREQDGGEEHVCGHGPEGWTGVPKAECDICCEIVGFTTIDNGVKYQTLRDYLGDDYEEN